MRGFKSKLFKCSNSTIEISEALVKDINPINTFILIHDLEDNKGYSIVSICSCGTPYIGKYLFRKSRKYRYIKMKKPIVFLNNVTVEVERPFESSNTGFLGWAIFYPGLNRIRIINNAGIPRSKELMLSVLTNERPLGS